MSKLSDYSKFDHLNSDSDDEGQQQENGTNKNIKPPLGVAAPPPPTAAAPALLPPPPPVSRMIKNEKNGRFVYEYRGNAIYEWEQNLEEVIIYIPSPPSHVRTDQIECTIVPHHLQLGLRNAKNYFIDEGTFGTVEVSESTWAREDDTLVIYLAKANKGQVWDVALKGNQQLLQQGEEGPLAATLDPIAKQQVQKEMMLERFQEENPGMDFRGAEFNGSVPDPRTFMGGVKYS